MWIYESKFEVFRSKRRVLMRKFTGEICSEEYLLPSIKNIDVVLSLTYSKREKNQSEIFKLLKPSEALRERKTFFQKHPKSKNTNTQSHQKDAKKYQKESKNEHKKTGSVMVQYKLQCTVGTTFCRKQSSNIVIKTEKLSQTKLLLEKLKNGTQSVSSTV